MAPDGNLRAFVLFGQVMTARVLVGPVAVMAFSPLEIFHSTKEERPAWVYRVPIVGAFEVRAVLVTSATPDDLASVPPIACDPPGVGALPSPLGRKAMEMAGVDRLDALYTAIDAVRRGGTISISGVYGGMKDPLPMMTMFDKQLQLRMGQCNVRRWTEDLLPLVDDPSDPLGVLDLKTHTAPLDEAPAMYEKFQKKEDGCIKVVLKP